MSCCRGPPGPQAPPRTSQLSTASAAVLPAARLAWFFSSWGRNRKMKGRVERPTSRSVSAPQSLQEEGRRQFSEGAAADWAARVRGTTLASWDAQCRPT